MPTFSKRSSKELGTCHYLLQDLMNRAIKETDFTVICGFRDKAQQEKAFAEGRSRAKWGQSKHNSWPSMAVDVVPYPIDWDDVDRFETLGIVIQRCWDEMPIEARGGWKLVWGKGFKGLVDYPHWELQKV